MSTLDVSSVAKFIHNQVADGFEDNRYLGTIGTYPINGTDSDAPHGFVIRYEDPNNDLEVIVRRKGTN